MFCNNCGKEIADDQKFCTNCGGSIGDIETGGIAAGQLDTTVQTGHSEQYVPNQKAYQQPYNSSGSEGMNRKKVTQAMALLFTTVTIITMLLNWFSLKIPISEIAGDNSGNFKLEDITLSSTSFQVSSVVHQINGFGKSILKEVERDYGSISDSEDPEVRSARKLFRSINIASFVMGLVKLFVVVAIIALLMFLYMMIVGNKNGALIGQMGSTLAFFAAIIFVISTTIFKVSILNILDNLEMDMSDNIPSIYISFNLYLTMAVSALNVVFITVRKNILRGE